MNLTFKKVILLSVLSVLLGVGLIYGISREFQPSSQFTPSFMATPISSSLFVFAYDGSNHTDGGSSFVQASVTITGPENPNPPLDNGVPVNVITLNGTTTTDAQNPLIFDGLWPGDYSVIGTYGSAPPQNETANVPAGGHLCDAFLNFGSVPIPPLGHIIVEAWDTDNQTNGHSNGVQASVTVTGPESHNGTTTLDYYVPLIFTVMPGEYSVFGTYDSAQPQIETVNVTPGSYRRAVLIFGNGPWLPPF